MKTTSLGYHESKASCGGCGTTAAERRKQFPKEPHGLSVCPRCGERSAAPATWAMTWSVGHAPYDT